MLLVDLPFEFIVCISTSVCQSAAFNVGICATNSWLAKYFACLVKPALGDIVLSSKNISALIKERRITKVSKRRGWLSCQSQVTHPSAAVQWLSVLAYHQGITYHLRGSNIVRQQLALSGVLFVWNRKQSVSTLMPSFRIDCKTRCVYGTCKIDFDLTPTTSIPVWTAGLIILALIPEGALEF